MSRNFFLIVFLSLTTVVHAQLWRSVNPLIGSEGEGRVFVGPAAPFGMVKPGPDCLTMPNAGWAPQPEMVKGFSQTHVSGTGGGQKYGNVLIQPFRRHESMTPQRLLLPDGKVGVVPCFLHHRTYEKITLGKYSCRFEDGIGVDITASARCALYRFRHADGLLVDAASFLGMDTIPNRRETQQYVASSISVSGQKEVSGSTTVRGGWNNGGPYTVFFCLQSSAPFVKSRLFGGRAASVWWGDSVVEVKVGISYVSVEQARRNIVAHDFDTQLRQLRQQWDETLARVPYEGNSRERRIFYTALYHTLLMPVDKTGECPRWSGTPYYDDFYALWDTYRTSMPLLMEYYPERATDIVRALLAIYHHEGYMPDARSGDCNGRTQGGSHADVVIAEAYVRGLKGIDYREALQAMLKDGDVPPANDEKEGRGGLREYIRLGYVPYGIPRAGTRTVEYSYDDWCIAQVAKGLGKHAIYNRYMRRSRSWQNLWRKDYEWRGMKGFILPRDARGRWLDSVEWGRSRVYRPKIAYRPDTKVAPWYIPWWDTFFYEGLSAEYSLSVPHDVPTLIQLCGGDSAFRRRLDIFFDEGHYNVGNEPSFLTPYLYSYIGRSDLSSRRVAEIVHRCFSDKADGLPGNDDSGAMSAWLLWAMLGRYPVAGQGKYITIEPVHFSEKTASVDADGTMVHFVLNRQYRNWPLLTCWQGDTLIVTCHDCTYRLPRHVVDHARAFCWESPQKVGAQYDAEGTFLFISRDALDSLQHTGRFVYDGITWRRVDESGQSIHVRADGDGTEMWISTSSALPWVREMRGNKLGIDWKIDTPFQELEN